MKFVIALLLLVLTACAASPPRPPATAKPNDALFRELGGLPAITAVVDRLLAKIDNDLRINLFFEKTDHADLRRLVIDQLCEATGGPCKYTGRSMEEAHSGLRLTDQDFSAFVEDLITAMNELNVPKASQDKLLAVLSPMKPQVVGQ